MNNAGYIKLYRQIRMWEWWDDINTRNLFISLLLDVNYTTGNWMGMTIEPGQTITTTARMMKQTRLSRQKLRSCLNRLQSTSEITIETTKRYHRITITNWALYQSDQEETTKGITYEQPTDNPQVTNKQPLYKNKRKKEEKNTRDDDLLDSLILDEVDEAMEAFREFRAKKKSPLTRKAEVLIRNKLETMAPNDKAAQAKILNQSTEMGWTGIYPLKAEEPVSSGPKKYVPEGWE